MEHAFSKPKEIVIIRSLTVGPFEQQQLASSGALVAKIHEIESHPPEDDWVISIDKKLGAASVEGADASWENVSIYRVPDHLKDPPPKDPSRHKAYTPQVVSLGPYHHGMARLQKMERQKWRVLQHVLKRNNLVINVFIESMKKLEGKARACYEEPLDQLNSNQFVEMMLLDGCFILETLKIAVVLEYFKKDGLKTLNYATDDPIFSKEGTMCSIQQDMLMLENQIPLIVLQELRELQGDSMHRVSNPTRAGLHFLSFCREDFLRGLPERVGEDEKRQKRNYCGTELFGIKIKISKGGPKAERVGEDKKRQNLNCCATELTNAGIKLREKKNGKLNSSLNIEFTNGIIYIPPIVIDDAFKSKFFNLIAFEQCHLDSNQRKITSYVSFLDGLIDSPEDVRCLRNHGIIDQMVGSDAEVADIINCLGHGVIFDVEDSYLSHLSGEINKYYKQKWHFWRVILKERYFNTPWAIISFVAAVILLIMTAAQTFYAVYSYYRPNK